MHLLILPNESIEVPRFTHGACSFSRSTEQFTIEAGKGERIWIQVIYMNLTSSALEILYSGDCKTNPNRLEITDSKCYGVWITKAHSVVRRNFIFVWRGIMEHRWDLKDTVCCFFTWGGLV